VIRYAAAEIAARQAIVTSSNSGLDQSDERNREHGAAAARTTIALGRRAVLIDFTATS
jgi:hypothetical protein